MPEVNLKPNFSLYYFDSDLSGGPPVLLLHGLGATGDSWQLQIPALKEAGFHVLAPDARGFGRSSYPEDQLTVKAMAGDYAALLEKLGTYPAQIVGLSMGGAAALQFSVSYAQYTRSLVLVNTFAALRPGSTRGWFYFALRLLLVHTLGLPTQAEFVSRRVFPKPEQELYRQAFIAQVQQANPRAYRSAMRALARFDLTRNLQDIQCPTLVITGKDDTTVPLRLQRRLAASIPGAEHVIIPGAGHAVSIDQSELFNRCLLEFLIKHSS
jgi:3-oxoadipate enol-lactonase